MPRINPTHNRAAAPVNALPSDLSQLLVALAVVATCALGLTQIWGMEPSLTSAPTPAQAWPGKLTAGERASVTAALGSTDPKSRELAESVAAGEAGALALGDPRVLHNHHLNTVAAAAGGEEPARAETFHHR